MHADEAAPGELSFEPFARNDGHVGRRADAAQVAPGRALEQASETAARGERSQITADRIGMVDVNAERHS